MLGGTGVEKDRGMVTVFMTPAVMMFALVFLHPIIRTTLTSFFKIEGITNLMPKWALGGIDNYVELADTTLFRTSMWNLARIWFIGGIIVMSLALLFAVIIASGIHFGGSFRVMAYPSNIVNAVTPAAMWFQYIYSPKHGLIKSSFQASGLDSPARIQWLDNGHKFMALLLIYCSDMTGYHTLISASDIKHISDDHLETVTLDGANKFGQLRYIILPLLKGAFRTNVIMWSVTSVELFVQFQLSSMVTADTQTITPMVHLYMQIFGAGNSVTECSPGVGATVGVILSICMVIVFWLCNHPLQDKDLKF